MTADSKHTIFFSTLTALHPDDAIISGGLPVINKRMIFDQNHEHVSLFMVLFENEYTVPVLSTQWNFGANIFLATFSHFSQCIIGGPTFNVPLVPVPPKPSEKEGSMSH